MWSIDRVTKEFHDEFAMRQIYDTSAFLKSASETMKAQISIKTTKNSNNDNNNSNNSNNNNDNNESAATNSKSKSNSPEIEAEKEEKKMIDNNGSSFDFDILAKLRNNGELKNEYIKEKSYLFIIDRIFQMCLDFDEFIELLVLSNDVDNGDDFSDMSDISEDSDNDIDIVTSNANKRNKRSKRNNKNKKTNEKDKKRITNENEMVGMRYDYNRELFWKSIMKTLNETLVHFIDNEKWWYLSRVYQTFHDLLQCDPSFVLFAFVFFVLLLFSSAASVQGCFTLCARIMTFVWIEKKIGFLDAFELHLKSDFLAKLRKNDASLKNVPAEILANVRYYCDLALNLKYGIFAYLIWISYFHQLTPKPHIDLSISKDSLCIPKSNLMGQNAWLVYRNMTMDGSLNDTTSNKNNNNYTEGTDTGPATKRLKIDTSDKIKNSKNKQVITQQRTIESIRNRSKKNLTNSAILPSIEMRISELLIAESIMIKLFLLFEKWLADEFINEFQFHVRDQFMFVKILIILLHDIKFLIKYGLFTEQVDTSKIEDINNLVITNSAFQSKSV